MAENLALPSPSGQATKEGTKALLLTLGLLTLLSALIGGGFGLSIVSNIEKRIEEKYSAVPHKPVEASAYTGDITIRKLAAVVTNLAGSETDWIRLEASLVYKGGIEFNPELLVAEARQDILAYLRTVTLAQIQGPSGLLHVREDLNERVKIRSNGLVQELVLETLVVQ
ncbi:flagellar basal body-associated FliL family protein [Microvirga sp. ACRRW]|uniref:flagellar basal body-associated FliL family protein n=1 Tax=Microvirga sp. ACRRW TaxID=2918205 RepID=UPI001EF5C2D6|nr:flagellar basal body-associated FliL family protein [Microvirga sp. ACRRW]MCG7392047.1 flagellar basal body-associated FliL family protein [Microvirga sp. ACRRW]